MKIAWLFVLAALVSSCCFNRQFYQPDKLPANMQEVRVPGKEKGDTSIIHFTGADHIATITDTHNQPKDIGYDLETININSTSGNRLYSWFLKPCTVPKATVLFLHGNGGNILSHIALVLPLVKRGYQVLLVDYSGYGFSSGNATRTKVVQDATSALDVLRARPDVQSTKIIIYGQSMGGQISSRTAVLNENKIDALVIEGAPSSHRDIAAAMFPLLSLPARLIVREKYTTAGSVSKFHKPVLIIHSTEDKVIPYRMGKKTFRHTNHPKYFYEIKHPHIYGPIYYADSITHKMSILIN